MTVERPAVALFDSGVQPSGARNQRLDRELLRRHAAGCWPDTLRFHRSSPTACVGFNQPIDRVLRLEHCARRGIETVRRITGGGALYLDENQQGVSLILRCPPRWQRQSLADLLQGFCQGLSAGLRALGLYAAYEFPNDLEIDGRKIASAFLAREGESLLFQGVVLLDADVGAMLEALRAPTEKLSADGLASARERLVTVRECLGAVPPAATLIQALARGIAAVMGLDADLAGIRSGPDIEPLADDGDDFDRRIDWSGEADLEAIWSTPGGVLRARVDFDVQAGAIRRAALAGDVHLHPADLFVRLEQGLTGLTPCMVEGAVHRIVGAARGQLAGFSPEDIARVLRLAVEKSRASQRLELREDRLMLHDPEEGGLPTETILAQAGAVLVPYCAKPAWCRWRHHEGCVECGLCEVGEVYRLARARGLRAVTITRYEHLVATLQALREEGATAYVGMCCSHFFIKRHRAFQEAGLAAVLVDIAGSNCYELKQEGEAYAGRFEARSRLDMDTVRQVMRFVPARQALGRGDRETAP